MLFKVKSAPLAYEMAETICNIKDRLKVHSHVESLVIFGLVSPNSRMYIVFAVSVQHSSNILLSLYSRM
jgi:hypothetical protein